MDGWMVDGRKEKNIVSGLLDSLMLKTRGKKLSGLIFQPCLWSSLRLLFLLCTQLSLAPLSFPQNLFFLIRSSLPVHSLSIKLFFPLTPLFPPFLESFSVALTNSLILVYWEIKELEQLSFCGVRMGGGGWRW